MTLDSKAILEEISKQSTVILLAGGAQILVDKFYYGFPLDGATLKDGVITMAIVAGAVGVGEAVGLTGKILYR